MVDIAPHFTMHSSLREAYTYRVATRSMSRHVKITYKARKITMKWTINIAPL